MQVFDAIEFARNAHEGQVDKGGKPYIEHPLRVMNAVKGSGENAMVVAVLHDVLEDTCLVPVGLNVVQWHGLTAITRLNNEAYFAYIERVKLDSIASAVKIADIEDNLSPERMENLPLDTQTSLTGRYHKALELLGEK